MKLKAIGLIVLSGLLISACAIEQSKIGSNTTTPDITVTPTQMSEKILDNDHILLLINQYRIQNGLVKLEKSTELCKLAEERASYLMADRMSAYRSSQIGNHTGFKKAGVGYSGTGVGENIGANLANGFKENPNGDFSKNRNIVKTNQDIGAVNQWKQSPPHNELLLSKEKGETILTKACVASRVEDYGMLTVFLTGDK